MQTKLTQTTWNLHGQLKPTPSIPGMTFRGFRPTQGPNAKAFASLWNIGLKWESGEILISTFYSTRELYDMFL